MEELNIDDLINGLASVDYAEYHVVFLQMLSNIVADEESSKDETVGKKVLEFSFKRLQKSRTDNNNEEIDLVLTILSNFTVLESNSTRFFEYLDTSADDAESFKVAVHAFLQPPPATEEDPYQKMAFLLCNLSRIDLGRRLLLKQTPLCPIEHILRQINKEESIRCKGAVGCLRNCLFDSEVHWWMIHELNVLPTILRPLVVNTPFTERERIGMDADLIALSDDPDTKPHPDVDVVAMLLDCIVLLCQKRGSREFLRKKKVYPVCRNVDYFFVLDKVNDIVFEIVNFLERDDDMTESDDFPPAPNSAVEVLEDPVPLPATTSASASASVCESESVSAPVLTETSTESVVAASASSSTAAVAAVADTSGSTATAVLPPAPPTLASTLSATVAAATGAATTTVEAGASTVVVDSDDLF